MNFSWHLIRLRQGFKEEVLADLFNGSSSTVSRKLVAWINLLYCVLASQPTWLTKDQVKRVRPKVFVDNHPNVRVILDCTKLRVQQFTSLLLQSELYSRHKSNPTVKSLIGIALNGATTFVSMLFTGSISDKEITRSNSSNRGMLLWQTKDFLIEDLLSDKGVGLNMPPFLRN